MEEEMDSKGNGWKMEMHVEDSEVMDRKKKLTEREIDCYGKNIFT